MRKNQPPIIQMSGPGNGLNCWYINEHGVRWTVARLVSIAEEKQFPVFEVPTVAFNTRELFPKATVESLVDMADYVNQANQADLSYPIILDPDGVVMDGRHRILKAIMTGERFVKAVRFDYWPEPDSR